MLDPADLDLIDLFLRWVRREPERFVKRSDGQSTLDPAFKLLIERSLDQLKQEDSPRAKTILLAYQFPGPANGALVGSDQDPAEILVGLDAAKTPSAKTIDWIVRAAEKSAEELNRWQSEQPEEDEQKGDRKPPSAPKASSSTAAIEIDISDQLSPAFWQYVLLARAAELIGSTVAVNDVTVAGSANATELSRSRPPKPIQWRPVTRSSPIVSCMVRAIDLGDIPDVSTQTVEAVHYNAGQSRSTAAMPNGRSTIGEPADQKWTRKASNWPPLSRRLPFACDRFCPRQWFELIKG